MVNTALLSFFFFLRDSINPVLSHSWLMGNWEVATPFCHYFQFHVVGSTIFWVIKSAYLLQKYIEMFVNYKICLENIVTNLEMLFEIGLSLFIFTSI